VAARRWLIKSDPDEYSAADLERDGTTVWDGVTNALAQKHMRAMSAGDDVLVYHTGDEKAVVAVARVSAAPRPDPKDKSGKLSVVALAFARWLPSPASLSTIKADKSLADFALVRIGRLSVMPVTAAQWKRIEAISKAAGAGR
jgi:predicted RNA-binding protein with PUA-like domain